MKYRDTYFLSSTQALKIASEQNKENRGYWLQACYYEGEKIDSDLPNLIHLPLENLVDDLASGIYRIPEKLEFEGLDISDDIKISILTHFKISIEYAKSLRKELNKHYLETAQNAKLDFMEPLRFYLLGDVNTRVIQHISKNIVDTLIDMNYEVLFEAYIGINDMTCFKHFADFNPHVVININNLNNRFISDEVFNFVWFQDAMLEIRNKNKMNIRKRDFIFHLTKSIKDRLLDKNITSTYQPFCINTREYKNRKDIERKRKIVFIGNSHFTMFDTLICDNKDESYQLLVKKFLQNGVVSIEYRELLSKKFNVTLEDLGWMINYIERDIALKYIVNIDLDYELEIYGNGFEDIPELAPYYKGVLKYGEDISKVYNSAMYSLVLGGYVMQQRTLESAASGCIPIVIDSRKGKASENEKCFSESLLFMQKLDELPELLNKKHDIDLACIVNENSYEHFTNQIITLVKENL
ncbi:MAG: hypothetical protein KAQ94_05315 [Arcobacteraceae bacterium]|nr:hypothetical protein [Arcobacteraceae bacterium]